MAAGDFPFHRHGLNLRSIVARTWGLGLTSEMGLRHAGLSRWRSPADQPCKEDGTGFFPHAAGASADIPLRHRRGVVVAEGIRPLAESMFAGVFLVSAFYEGFSEGPANWQSLWTCAAYMVLAATLWQVRA